jgi:hypothetical protein
VKSVLEIDAVSWTPRSRGLNPYENRHSGPRAGLKEEDAYREIWNEVDLLAARPNSPERAAALERALERLGECAFRYEGKKGEIEMRDSPRMIECRRSLSCAD